MTDGKSSIVRAKGKRGQLQVEESHPEGRSASGAFAVALRYFYSCTAGRREGIDAVPADIWVICVQRRPGMCRGMGPGVPRQPGLSCH